MTKQDLYDAIGTLDGAYCRQALQNPEKNVSAPGKLLRVTSAAAAAAVFVCVAGVSVWFAGSLHSESSFQTGNTAGTENTGLTEEAAEESNCAEQPVAYGELELHQCLDERNPEDAAWLETALNNQEPLLPIDRAPYIAKFMEPAGDPQAAEAKFAELNTLEYKSYVYHMMLNSVDYYKTAHGLAILTRPEEIDVEGYELEFWADLSAQQFYEHRIFTANYTDAGIPFEDELYIADGMRYCCTESQVYETESVPAPVPNCIPDNARCYREKAGLFSKKGKLCYVQRNEPVDQTFAYFILHPQELAMTYLWDFDTWEITGLNDLYHIGIEGVMIRCGSMTIEVDPATGILLYMQKTDADGKDSAFYVAEMEIDTDIAVQLHESTEAISSGGAVALHECYDEHEHPEWIESARSNKEPIPPIDRTPYLAKYAEVMLEDNETQRAALNTLEFKSYLYHIMLNSVDYYKTAQGSVRLVMPDGSIDYEVDFQADLTAEQCYEKRLLYTEGVNSPIVDETYIADGKQIFCVESRVTEETEALPQLPNCLTDNARCYRGADGACRFESRRHPVKRMSAHFVLLPDDYAMTSLWDFDKWEIIDTCRYVNRDAVIVRGEDFTGHEFTAAIDVETGMPLRTDAVFDDGIQTVEVTKLEIDTDIEVKQFDRTKYTEE